MGGFAGPPGRGGLSPLAIDLMSPEQLRELIGNLQRALEAKTRGEPRDRGDGRAEPERREGPERRAAPERDDVLRRLDQLTKEVEELRRMMRK
jgi:hypothetical protein